MPTGPRRRFLVWGACGLLVAIAVLLVGKRTTAPATPPLTDSSRVAIREQARKDETATLSRANRPAKPPPEDSLWRTSIRVPDPPAGARWGPSLKASLKSVVSEPLMDVRGQRLAEAAAHPDLADFPEILAWLQDLDPPNLAEALVIELFERWGKEAPEGARAWISSAPEGGIRDSAQFGIERSPSYSAPEP